MIVVEGTPGAGKTSRLAALLAERPDALIFPEAQPPPGATHPTDLDSLLGEDQQRTRHSADVAARFPHLVIASDRCHLAVLAYRYALTATGRAARGVFEQALEQTRRLDLDARHHHDEIHITILDPDQSRRRRARFAGDDRYQRWFDPAFLAAYNRFLGGLDRWVTPGPRWRTDTTPATGHGLCVDSRQTAMLRCTRGCTENRSPVLDVGDARVQLYTDALHHRAHNQAPVTCLRTAAEITSAWRARAETHRHPTQQAARPAGPARRGTRR